jgi:hypothetical protein
MSGGYFDAGREESDLDTLPDEEDAREIFARYSNELL